MTITEALKQGKKFYSRKFPNIEYVTSLDNETTVIKHVFKKTDGFRNDALLFTDENGLGYDWAAENDTPTPHTDVFILKEKKTVWIRMYKTDMKAQKTGLDCGLCLYETKKEADYVVADRDNYLGAYPIEVEI